MNKKAVWICFTLGAATVVACTPDDETLTQRDERQSGMLSISIGDEVDPLGGDSGVDSELYGDPSIAELCEGATGTDDDTDGYVIWENESPLPCPFDPDDLPDFDFGPDDPVDSGGEAQCPDGLVCAPPSVGAPPLVQGQCTQSCECATSEECLTGVCRDGQCDFCRPSQSDCADSPAGETCREDGSCGCETGEDCQGSAWGPTCRADGQCGCETDVDCDPGYSCSPDGKCEQEDGGDESCPAACYLFKYVPENVVCSSETAQIVRYDYTLYNTLPVPEEDNPCSNVTEYRLDVMADASTMLTPPVISRSGIQLGPLQNVSGSAVFSVPAFASGGQTTLVGEARDSSRDDGEPPTCAAAAESVQVIRPRIDATLFVVGSGAVCDSDGRRTLGLTLQNISQGGCPAPVSYSVWTWGDDRGVSLGNSSGSMQLDADSAASVGVDLNIANIDDYRAFYVIADIRFGQTIIERTWIHVRVFNNVAVLRFLTTPDATYQPGDTIELPYRVEVLGPCGGHFAWAMQQDTIVPQPEISATGGRFGYAYLPPGASTMRTLTLQVEDSLAVGVDRFAFQRYSTFGEPIIAQGHQDIVVRNADLDADGLDENEMESPGLPVPLAPNANLSSEADAKVLAASACPTSATDASWSLSFDPNALQVRYRGTDIVPGELHRCATHPLGAGNAPEQLQIWGRRLSLDAGDQIVTLNVEYDDGSSPLPDSVRLTVFGVDIRPVVSGRGVPRFLFAGASYATPVHFQVRPFESVYIDSVDVTVRVGGEEIQGGGPYSLGNGRMVARGFSWTRVTSPTDPTGNGLSNRYTSYVPANAYANIALPTGKTQDAVLVLDVRFRPEGYDAPLHGRSSFTDNAARIDVFADRSHSAVDLGPWYDARVTNIDIREGNQGSLSSSGSGEYLHSRDFCVENNLGCSAPHPAGEHVDDVPLYYPAHANNGDYGFEWYRQTGYNSLHATGNSAGAYMLAHTRLWDAGMMERTIGEPTYAAQAFSNSMLDVQLGGHAFISYGPEWGLEDVLATGEYGMDLKLVSGEVAIKMFEGARLYTELMTIVDDPVFDDILPLFLAGIKITSSLYNVDPFTVFMRHSMSEASRLIRSYLNDAETGSGEVMLSRVLGYSEISSPDVFHDLINLPPIRVHGNSGADITPELDISGSETVTVGTQVIGLARLDAVVSAQTHTNFLIDLPHVEAKIAFGLLNSSGNPSVPANSDAARQFFQMRLTTKALNPSQQGGQ